MVEAVTSYKASSDGSLHDKKADAISCDIQNEIDSWFSEPLNDSRPIARYLQDHNRRERLMKLLEEF